MKRWHSRTIPTLLIAALLLVPAAVQATSGPQSAHFVHPVVEVEVRHAMNDKAFARLRTFETLRLMRTWRTPEAPGAQGAARVADVHVVFDGLLAKCPLPHSMHADGAVGRATHAFVGLASRATTAVTVLTATAVKILSKVVSVAASQLA